METVTLREWTEADAEPFAAMNRDPAVMRYFPALASREQSDALLLRIRRAIEQRGWGLWAVEVDGRFAGMTGLSIPSFTAPFTPCVEVGWRFRPEFWGRGLAYRAACVALRYGFGDLSLPEIVSFTAVENAPSRRLMERLAMTLDPDGGFDHPLIAEGHPLRRHVLYRLRRSAWKDPGKQGGGVPTVR